MRSLVLLSVAFFAVKSLYGRPHSVYKKRISKSAYVRRLEYERFWEKANNFTNYYLKTDEKDLNVGALEIAYFEKYIHTSDSFFKKQLPETKFQGSILVAKRGKIVYERYSGFQDREKKIPVSSKTSFHIASVSKTFTAMVVLKLEEQKKLNIDDPVAKYLPDFAYTDVTIRDLLDHRSGLNTYNNFMDYYWLDKQTFCNNMDILTNVSVHSATKIFPTKKFFFYSNTNYVLLASIIEKITGIPFQTYMKQYVFTPLKMKDTYVFSTVDTSFSTPSYDEKGRREPYQYLDAVVGDKNVYTTARDLLHWDLALYNPSYFSRALLRKAYSPYSFERNSLENYGLGWRLRYLPKLDKFVPYHYGWWHGNRSMFIRDIENKVTIIVLSNKLNKNMYKSFDLVEIFSHLDKASYAP